MGIPDAVRTLERELREGERDPALTDEQVDFLYGLPERVELDLPGLGHVLFCHATPQNDVDMVTPLTPDARLRPDRTRCPRRRRPVRGRSAASRRRRLRRGR